MSKTETLRNGKLAIVLMFGLVLGIFTPVSAAPAVASTVVVTSQVPASSSSTAKAKTVVKSNKKAVNASKKRAKVASAAKKGVGVKYRTGGTTRNGWDCSGLVTYAYKKAGVKPKNGRWTTRTLKYDKKFKKTTKPKVGDVVYQGSGHIGIYMGKKKGKHTMISARNPRAGTTYHPVYNWNGNPKISFYTLKA